jgi:hypothetical protein
LARKETTNMTAEERIALIHFNSVDVPLMSEEEIRKRIEALKEIEDSPHFMWALPVKDEHRKAVADYNRTTLNGHACSHIYLLEEELKKRAGK